MTKRGLKSATVARRLAALRSIVKLARTLGRIVWSLDIESPKVVPYRDTRGPGDSGWYLLLGIARGRAERGGGKAVRDLAILRLLHDLALRRGELVALDLADLDLTAGTLAILGKGQTDKQRVTLPAPTRDALAGWLRVRSRYHQDRPGPLFIRLDNGGRFNTIDCARLTADGLYLIIRELGRTAKLPVLRPHGIRHQAITQALDVTDGNIRAVQKFSRHVDPRTLMRYDDSRKDEGGDVAKKIAGE